VDVSIIVVAWNVRELLYDCLKSVYEETRGLDCEVIYVDNASQDGSVEMVRDRLLGVRIIENEKNEGFVIANNKGIEAATGRYVLLLNSDTIVLDNAIKRAVEFADAHRQAAVVGCKVLNPDGTLQRDCFMYPSILNTFISAMYLNKIFPRSRFCGRERMTWCDFDQAMEVETVAGCFSLVRKEAIEQVGAMDPIYYVFGDDPDWCYRFRKAGWKIMFTPGPRIIHYKGQNIKQDPEKFFFQMFGSRLIFFRKFRSRLTFSLACFLTGLFFALRVPYWLVVAMLSKEQRKSSISKSRKYLTGVRCCLLDWTDLLMNKEQVKQKLRSGELLA